MSDNVTDIVELTADERELLEGQLHWVPCPHCKGESASYAGGEFCPVCLNGERVLKTTAHILANFLPFYDSAQADLATLRKQLDDAREALNGYRAAVSFISADSWDGCSDCINILKAARCADMTEAMTINETAEHLKRIRLHYDPAALRALPTVSDGWEDIATANKEEMILGHADGMVRLVMWESGMWLQVGATIEPGWFEPTEWKPLGPLPAPPSE